MDIFTRFNRKSIDDRQIDTLIGISKGIIANNEVDQKEAEFLLTWLIQSKQNTESPIIANLLNKVEIMMSDNLLDKDESQELLAILRQFSGEESQIGELAKATTLPIDQPTPAIEFQDKIFVLTGTFSYGTRKECEETIERLNGKTAKNITKNTDYMVIGSYVTDSWKHETFGRKIEKAIEYKNKGISIKIVTEDSWANAAKL